MEKIGCFNESADKVKRVDKTWSDTNLEKTYTEEDAFERLKCDCGCKTFEVLSTDCYETSSRCNNCGKYFKVHCG
jgi:hypothetical protein